MEEISPSTGGKGSGSGGAAMAAFDPSPQPSPASGGGILPVSAMPDLASDIAARVDSYFNRTKQIVARFGDRRVTYAVFLRRPVISAPRLMTEWLATVADVHHRQPGAALGP